MNTQNKTQKGSVSGAILLIAGCCIGAGMLGLPVMTAVAGFKPSFAMFFLSWLFMTTTALMLLEVNLWFSDEISIITMANQTLGMAGKVVAWLCFAFLFYALGVAYIAASGELIAAFVREGLGISVPNWIGSVCVSLLFGIFVYLGTGAVDKFNRLLMGGVVISYLLLVVFGLPHIQIEYLKYHDWSAATLMLPVMIISFGFHNLIPSLTTYLNRDARRLRFSIVCGSAIPLIIYLIWEWLILGLVPTDNKESFLEVLDKGNLATELLRKTIGSPWVVKAAEFFAFFAILTSFLGNSLSFVDFLADGLKVKKTHSGKLGLCILVIAPSLALALMYPRIFLTALNYAGAFGAVILFGILPALMIWIGRYRKNMGSAPMVPGGRGTVAAVLLFAFWVIAMQFFDLT